MVGNRDVVRVGVVVGVVDSGSGRVEENFKLLALAQQYHRT